jgi:hypothetical protein
MISGRYFFNISLLLGKPPIAMITDSTVPVNVSPAIPGRPPGNLLRSFFAAS